MAAILLSPSRPRFRIGLALAVSALLHGAAVAFADFHRPAPLAEIQWPDSPDIVIDPDETTLPPSPPPEIPDLPPPPIPTDASLFTDSVPPPPPLRPTKLPSQPIPKRPSQPTAGRSSPAARALALHAPLPDYPYEARRSRITGEGVAILSVDSASGQVTGVSMAQSTGSPVLDHAALAGLRRWRFRPGTPAQVRCPITYTLSGAGF